MAVHAVLGPSSAARWTTCPGSVLLSEGRDNSGRAAAEGSVLHLLAADVLEGRGFEARGFVGAEYTHEGYTFVIDDEQADAVQAYVDEARDAIGASDFMVETRVPIDHLTGEQDAHGTADLIVLRLSQRELEVRDAKFGSGVEVEAENNLQGIMYALGALRVMEELGYAGDFDTVRVVIHQPRLSGPKEWTLTVAELLAWVPVLREAARRVEDAVRNKAQISDDEWDAEFLRPSNAACKFCPAKAVCPALQREAERDILEDFAAMDGIDTDNLAAQMERIPRVEAWVKAVRAEVERRLAQGVPVPGWKLVAGRAGNRQYKDGEQAVIFLERTLGKDDAYERKLLTPAAAEKKLKAVGAGFPDDFLKQATGKPSVAPESDKRPAITLGATLDEFDNLESED